MAFEHVLMTQKTFPVSMTVADGTAVEKGTVLVMTDPNTTTKSAVDNEVIGGIAYTEKVANNGNTQIAVLTGPGDELRAYASGTIAIGDPLVTSGDTAATHLNYLSSGIALDAGDLSGSRVIGYAKETCTNGQTFKYTLNIQALLGLSEA